MQQQPTSLIPSSDILKQFTFHYDDEKNSSDVFFCRCGNIIEKDRKNEATEMKISVKEGTDISDLTSLFDGNSSARFSLKCDACDTDYSTLENASFVQDINKKFFEAYCFEETEENVFLYKQRFEAKIDIEENIFVSETIKKIHIEEHISYFRYDKTLKALYFKDYNAEEKDFTLDSIMGITKSFFLPGEAKITDKLFDIHLFINRMANFVSDSKNINIIDELMSQMIGRAGLDIMSKITSIFFGIICYPNLSTIAMTKGTVFLYDMMNDCSLPNPKELTDNSATSPLKIFNYLVNFKNAEIAAELNLEDRSKAGYLYKNEKGEERLIKFDSSRFDNEKQVINNNKSGEMFLREDITKKSVSPYIFNSIKKFSDYKIIIKYTKFISYTELVTLVQKHEIDLLINLIPVVEYRAGINFKELTQVISLATSFLEKRASMSKNVIDDFVDLKYVREKFVPEGNEEKVQITTTDTEPEKIIIDYTLLRNFDLNEYDDSLRMIRALNWDPNKEFYKIKKIKDLIDYHNQLTEHFNLLSNEEKNKDFNTFVMRYKVLEEYDIENCPLKIKTIKTPNMLLDYAKTMKNCAGSYVNRVSDEKYVLCIISDIDNERKESEPKEYMLGFIVDKYGHLEFDQVKAACNVQGPDRFKKNVMDYLQEKEISYKELSDLKLSTDKRENKLDFNIGIDLDYLAQL